VHRLPSTGTYTVVRPDGYVALVARDPAPVAAYFRSMGA
jgi:hypothetical protein